jgi:ACS family D-galactonate transporter-like MFS transporter
MAKIGGAAYIGGAIFALVSGWLSDGWIKSGATPTRVRKTFVCSGLAFGGVALLLSALTEPIFSVAFLILGIGLQHVCSSNIWALTQTLAGVNAAGRWTALQNFAGNLAGVAAPALTGWLLDRTHHFVYAFAIMTIIAVTGAASWLFIVGPVQEVSWPVKATAIAVALDA